MSFTHPCSKLNACKFCKFICCCRNACCCGSNWGNCPSCFNTSALSGCISLGNPEGIENEGGAAGLLGVAREITGVESE